MSGKGSSASKPAKLAAGPSAPASGGSAVPSTAPLPGLHLPASRLGKTADLLKINAALMPAAALAPAADRDKPAAKKQPGNRQLSSSAPPSRPVSPAENVQCEHCGAIYKSESTKLAHLAAGCRARVPRVVSPAPETAKKRWHVCPLCHSGYETLADLTHHQSGGCGGLAKRTSSSSLPLKSSMGAAESPAAAQAGPLSPAPFSTAAGGFSLGCQACGKVLKSTRELLRHACVGPASSRDPTTGLDSASDGEGGFRCEHCKFTFSTKNRVDNHSCKVLPKRHCCPDCNMAFTSYFSMDRHRHNFCTRAPEALTSPVKSHHPGLVVVSPDVTVCPHCGLDFGAPDLRIRHSCPLDPTNVLCHECGIRLRDFNLSRHLSKFCVGRTASMQCVKCGDRFTDLIRHNRHLCNSEGKPTYCEHCGAKFCIESPPSKHVCPKQTTSVAGTASKSPAKPNPSPSAAKKPASTSQSLGAGNQPQPPMRSPSKPVHAPTVGKPSEQPLLQAPVRSQSVPKVADGAATERLGPSTPAGLPRSQSQPPKTVTPKPASPSGTAPQAARDGFVVKQPVSHKKKPPSVTPSLLADGDTATPAPAKPPVVGTAGTTPAPTRSPSLKPTTGTPPRRSPIIPAAAPTARPPPVPVPNAVASVVKPVVAANTAPAAKLPAQTPAKGAQTSSMPTAGASSPAVVAGVAAVKKSRAPQPPPTPAQQVAKPGTAATSAQQRSDVDKSTSANVNASRSPLKPKLDAPRLPKGTPALVTTSTTPVRQSTALPQPTSSDSGAPPPSKKATSAAGAATALPKPSIGTKASGSDDKTTTAGGVGSPASDPRGKAKAPPNSERKQTSKSSAGQQPASSATLDGARATLKQNRGAAETTQKLPEKSPPVIKPTDAVKTTPSDPQPPKTVKAKSVIQGAPDEPSTQPARPATAVVAPSRDNSTDHNARPARRAPVIEAKKSAVQRSDDDTGGGDDAPTAAGHAAVTVDNPVNLTGSRAAARDATSGVVTVTPSPTVIATPARVTHTVQAGASTKRTSASLPAPPQLPTAPVANAPSVPNTLAATAPKPLTDARPTDSSDAPVPPSPAPSASGPRCGACDSPLSPLSPHVCAVRRSGRAPVQTEKKRGHASPTPSPSPPPTPADNTTGETKRGRPKKVPVVAADPQPTPADASKALATTPTSSAAPNVTVPEKRSHQKKLPVGNPPAEAGGGKAKVGTAKSGAKPSVGVADAATDVLPAVEVLTADDVNELIASSKALRSQSDSDGGKKRSRLDLTPAILTPSNTAMVAIVPESSAPLPVGEGPAISLSDRVGNAQRVTPVGNAITSVRSLPLWPSPADPESDVVPLDAVTAKPPNASTNANASTDDDDQSDTSGTEEVEEGTDEVDDGSNSVPEDEPNDGVSLCRYCRRVAGSNHRCFMIPKELTCEPCGMGFSSIGVMRRHRAKSCTGRKYPCRGCGIAFPNLVIKAGHVCISTVSGDADEDGSDIGEGDDASSSDTDVPADTDTDDSSEQLFTPQKKPAVSSKGSGILNPENCDCPVCGMHFEAKTGRAMHIKFKHPKFRATMAELTCQHCNMIFKNRTHLRAHGPLVHPRRPVTQKQSLISFEQFKAILEDHQCPFCTYATSRASTLSVHVASSHDAFLNAYNEATRRCFVCHQAHTSQMTLLTHASTAHREMWEGRADVVVQSDVTDDSDESEDNDDSGESSDSSSHEDRVCGSCGSAFTSASLLERHEKKCTPPNARGLPVPSPSALTSSGWRCRVCSQTFRQQWLLTVHLAEKHGAAARAREEGEAPTLSSTADSDATALSSNSDESDIRPSPEDSSLKPSLDRTKCPFCLVRFKTFRGVSSHVQAAHSSRVPEYRVYICICAVCNIRVTSRKSLERHLTSQHGLSLKCEKKGEGEESSSDPDTHLAPQSNPGAPSSLSEGEDGDSDDEGGASDKDSDDSVSGEEKEREYPCQHCDKVFMSRFALASHGRCHPSSKHLIVMKCTPCNKSFVYPSQVKRHNDRKHGGKPIATGWPPVATPAPSASPAPFAPPSSSPASPVDSLTCDVCGNVYETIGQLRTHRGWHSRWSTPLTPTDAGSNPASVPHLPQRKEQATGSRAGPAKRPGIVMNPGWGYPCGTCPLEFSLPAQLRTHYREAHREGETGESHDCHLCGASFALQWALESHMTLHPEAPRRAPTPNGGGLKRQRPVNECEYCGVTTDSAQALEEHITSNHGAVVSAAAAMCACPHCPAHFISSTLLAEHTRESHASSSGPQQAVSRPPWCSNGHTLPAADLAALIRETHLRLLGLIA